MDMVADAKIQGNGGGRQKEFGNMQLFYHIQCKMAVKGFFPGHIEASGENGLEFLFFRQDLEYFQGIGNDGEPGIPLTEQGSQLKGGGTGIQGNSVPFPDIGEGSQRQLPFFFPVFGHTGGEAGVALHFMYGDSAAVYPF